MGYHLWSLSAEEQFYAIFPFLFLPALSNPRVTFPLLVVGIPCAALALYSIHEPAAASVLVRDFQCIALGVTAAIFEPAARRMAMAAPLSIVTLAVLFMGGVGALPASRLATMLGLFVGPAIALVVLWSLDAAFPLRVLFLSKPVQFIGKISYSLYLWQQLATYPYPGAGIVFYAGVLVALFAVATVSWVAVEQPLLGIGKRISQRIQRRNSLRPAQAG